MFENLRKRWVFMQPMWHGKTSPPNEKASRKIFFLQPEVLIYGRKHLFFGRFTYRLLRIKAIFKLS